MRLSFLVSVNVIKFQVTEIFSGLVLIKVKYNSINNSNVENYYVIFLKINV
jgi:hypothetical protein